MPSKCTVGCIVANICDQGQMQQNINEKGSYVLKYDKKYKEFGKGINVDGFEVHVKSSILKALHF